MVPAKQMDISTTSTVAFKTRKKCMPMPPNIGRSEKTGGNLAK